MVTKEKHAEMLNHLGLNSLFHHATSKASETVNKMIPRNTRRVCLNSSVQFEDSFRKAPFS